MAGPVNIGRPEVTYTWICHDCGKEFDRTVPARTWPRGEDYIGVCGLCDQVRMDTARIELDKGCYRDQREQPVEEEWWARLKRSIAGMDPDVLVQIMEGQSTVNDRHPANIFEWSRRMERWMGRVLIATGAAELADLKNLALKVEEQYQILVREYGGLEVAPWADAGEEE